MAQDNKHELPFNNKAKRELMQPLITVAISTMGARVANISLPEETPGIEYLVLVQRSDGIQPAALERRDVTVLHLKSLGLSNSRNAALTQANGDFLLFNDDDIELNTTGILELQKTFIDDPKLALAAGWRRERLPKSGARAGIHRLRTANSGRICAPEFMLRLSLVRAANITFDPKFGLGAEFGLGEEFIFITDALKAGLKGVGFPIVTGAHPDESTGNDWQDPALMRARAAMLARVFGRRAAIARMAYAWRYRSRIGSTRRCLGFAFGGGACE